MFIKEVSIKFSNKDYICNRIKVSSLMSVFEEIATTHAVDLKIGFNDLIERNIIWVISKLKINILNALEKDKTVILKTFIDGCGKFEVNRYFEVYQNGKICVTATYCWCLIDACSRKLVSFENINCNCLIKKLISNKDVSLKLHEFNNKNCEKFQFLVENQHIDQNQHMNNKVYANILEEDLNCPINQIIINFYSELVAGDQMNIFKIQEGNVINFMGIHNQNKCFLAKVTI